MQRPECLEVSNGERIYSLSKIEWRKIDEALMINKVHYRLFKQHKKIIYSNHTQHIKDKQRNV